MVKKEVEHAIQRVYMYALVSSKRKKKKNSGNALTDLKILFENWANTRQLATRHRTSLKDSIDYSFDPRLFLIRNS